MKTFTAHFETYGISFEIDFRSNDLNNDGDPEEYGDVIAKAIAPNARFLYIEEKKNEATKEVGT